MTNHIIGFLNFLDANPIIFNNMLPEEAFRVYALGVLDIQSCAVDVELN